MSVSHAEPIYSCLAQDPDFGDLVEMYVNEMPERMATLRLLFEAGEWLELNRHAHQLKGSAGGYGFDAITPFAARLERASDSPDDADAIEQALLQLLEVCCLIRGGVPR